MKETKLKKLLKERGVKQTFIAKKIGMPVKSFNDVVIGRVALKLDLAKKIAEALNISLEDFF